MKLVLAIVTSAVVTTLAALGVAKLYDIMVHDGDSLFSTRGLGGGFLVTLIYVAVVGSAAHISLKRRKRESYFHYALVGGLIPVILFYSRELLLGVMPRSFYDAVWVLYFGSIGIAQGCAYRLGLDVFERKKPNQPLEPTAPSGRGSS